MSKQQGPKEIDFYKLTKSELEIMNVLWSSEVPLMATEFVKVNTELNLSTVRARLQKLLRHNYIEVADHQLTGTTITRSYVPFIAKSEYRRMNALETFTDIVQTHEELSSSLFLLTLLDAKSTMGLSVKDIEEMEQLLKERKKAL